MAKSKKKTASKKKEVQVQPVAAPIDDNIEAISQREYAPVPEFEELVEAYGNDRKKALFEYCYKHNIGYINKLVNRVISNVPGGLPQAYIDLKELSPDFRDVTFFSQLRMDNFDKIYSTDYSISLLDEEDRKNRLQVIDILGYDPFKDDDQAEKPGLYRDMTGMLTESMRKDVAKAKAAIAFVRGYNNLEKYQRKINDIMKMDDIDEDTQERLDQYIRVQKTLQDSINQTAEKNNFIVKGLGSNGVGMLSDVINQVEEKGIDDGITNFYDIATSRSIEEVANISMRAQLNQINLSKTDYADILGLQSKMVHEAQAKAATAEEALRLCKEKLKKQELIDELAAEYRAKGISEDEIEEFIAREYHMYDDAKS